MFQELHAQAAVARYRRFAYYVPRGKQRSLELPATLAAWEKSLNSWYVEHLRDKSAQVFWRRHGEDYLFYVRHGEPVKREGSVGLKACESGSAIYRPERHGLVICNTRLGELRIHADSEAELELFRLTFGLHLFRDGNYFPASSHKFTLEPLRQGRKALAWAGIPGVRGVTLVGIELAAGSDPLVRDKTKAPDVFAVFEARKFQIPVDAEIRLARLAVLFEGETEHPSAMHDGPLTSHRTGVAEHRGDRRRGAVGRTGYGIRYVVRDFEDGGALWQMTVLSQAADQSASRDDSFVTELHEPLALGLQAALAVEALATTPYHGPRHAIPQHKRTPPVVARPCRAGRDDLGHHLVTEHARSRRVAPALERVQI